PWPQGRTPPKRQRYFDPGPSWWASLSQTDGDRCALAAVLGARTVGRTVEVAGAAQRKVPDVESPISYYDWFGAEIHEPARKHGVGDDDIVHAVEHAVAVYDIGEGDDEPIRSLHLGPDRAGNPLEMVVLELDDGRWLVIHAMRIRRRYQGLLTDNRGGEDERSG
ncbi:MAG: hypothetical protein ACRDTT_28965, partial [Pseudonocardiaceae bacterium]